MTITSSFLRRCAGAFIAAALAAATACGAAAGKPLWTSQLPGDAKWHALTGLGTLLVGTNDAIVAIDPESGQTLWTRNEFRKTSPHNARELPGTPFLMCHTSEGLGGQKTKLYQIDYLTGKTLWETPQFMGQYLGTIPVVEKDMVLFVLNLFGGDGKEAGIYVRAYGLDGTEKWSSKFAKPGGIPLHIADNSGKFIPTMDLSGYHDPVVDGNEIFLGYLGVHCLDLGTGAVKWGVEFEPGNKGLKKTYAPLRIAGDRIYGGGGGSVYAIDRKTGQQLWKSDRISDYAGLFKARDNAIVSQLEVVNGKIFSRYGGNFSDGKTVQLREPIGIVVLDPADGKSLHHFDQAKEGITNMVIVPETNLVVFADGGHVFGIDAAAATPAEAFRMPIEFKTKMGVGGVAKIGLGALGGVTGLVKATVSANKARLDVPVAVNLVGRSVVVQGKQHLLAFDPATKTSNWSLFYGAPSDALGNAALFAVTAAAALYGNGQVAASGGFASGGYSSGVNTIHSNLDRYNQYTEKAAKRAGGSKAAGGYTYIVTKLEKDIGVVGVNLATGATDRELPLKEKEPDYRVDEPMNRVFHFKGKDTVVAYQF